MFDWDAIVIGGGPAGLTAGLYLGRGNIRTMILEEEIFGGKIKNLELIENYSGFPEGISGPELAANMFNQATKYGVKFETGKATGFELYSGSKCITCADGKSYTTTAIIIAGGSQHKKLGVPGEKEFTGRGVFECAFCDGGQYQDQVVVVCGGGDAGITEALYLTKIASKVILIETMPSLTASAILQDRAKENPKMSILLGKKVEAIIGNDKVQAVAYVDVASGKKETLKTDGVLVDIGLDPNTDYLESIVPLDERKQIIVNGKMETEVPLILAAGDIRSGSSGQVASAVGDGATAAISAIRQLQQK